MQTIVEGTTDPIIDQLLLDGVATESLASHAVECLLWDKTGALKNSMGTTAIVTASTRIVKFTPGAGKLIQSESPYKQRWKITRPTGEIYFHPGGGAGCAQAETWKVVKP